MNKSIRALYPLAVLLILIATARATWAQGARDRIQRTGGIDSGTIMSTSVLDVTVSKGGVDKKIPAEEIVGIYFSGEPAKLNSARLAVDGGRYQEAQELLGEINRDSIRRDEITGDVNYFTAAANARLALAGRGRLDDAVAEVTRFLAENRSSFRVPAAIELLGDLHAAAKNYDQARQQYAKLGKAPSPYYKLKSALLTGRAWQAEDEHQEALAEFDRILSSTESGPTIDPIRLAATLDQAVSRAASGNAAGSTDAISKIVAEADPEDAELLARAYNALGEARLKAGDKQAALFAFLHVDLLYHEAGDSHAQALERLVPLWKDLGHADRSEATAKKLATQYPNSRGR